MTVLYHGTNVHFESPDVDAGREGMDFGKGFYLTPNLDTAKKQADRVVAYAGGSFGKGRKWKLETVTLTDRQKKELDLLLKDMMDFLK